MYFNSKHLFQPLTSCIGICLTLSACMSTPLSIDPVSAVELKESLTSSDEDHLKYFSELSDHLKRITENDELLEAMTLDIRLFIESQIANAQGNIPLAEKQAFGALKNNKDDLSQLFFEWWLPLAVKANFKSPPRPDALAAYVLAKTEGDKHCLFIKEGNLNNNDSLAKWISDRHSELVEQGTPVSTVEAVPAPKAGEFPSIASLSVVLQHYCGMRKLSASSWESWIQSLGADQQLFIKAGSLRVCDREAEGGKELEALGREYERQKKMELYFYTLAELINHYRATGNREKLSDAYLEQTKLWESGIINESNLGTRGIDFDIRKINDFLWGARYRALTGDYENSKILAQKATKFVTQSFSQHHLADSSAKGRDLKELQVEAQHIIAFRVAIEKNDLEGARALYELALRTPGISDNWRMILVWHHGLLRFISGDFEKSLTIWSEILNSRTKDAERMRDAVLFWSARAHLKLGHKSTATEYTLSLIKDHPFSFYTLNGISSTELRTLIEGSEISDLFKVNFNNFDETQTLNLPKWREDSKIGNALVRAEILIHLGHAELAQGAVRSLNRLASGEKSPLQSPEIFIYITRLQSAAGLSYDAIKLNQKLSDYDQAYLQKWPEQIFIMYPTPYKDIYTRHALATGVDWTLLLAVSRQESMFQASAISPTGARGLMQLMPETGRQLSASANLEISDIRSALLFPETNINLGSQYLRNLSIEFHEFVPAILSAYNSGSYTTQAWLKQRYQKDPLLWVELIPFTETREYVKKVWRNQIVYRNLYPEDSLKH